MPALRFTSVSNLQLQQAHRHLASQKDRSTYDTLVSTLVSLERDAALFTLLEATPLLSAPAQTYVVSTGGIDIAYQLSATDEDIVVHSIRWS